MKALTLLLSALIGSTALADGFVCENLQENVRLKVFNHTQPAKGTRNSAIMVISDPSVSEGRKTIAAFEAENSLLTSDSAVYTAMVDLRYKDSQRKGENFAGTKLGNTKFIILDVDFTYSRPVPAGTELQGELIVKRRSGDDIRLDVSCLRYLKN